MLFTGYSEHTIDPKLRLAIPAKYRNQWSPARDGSAWFCLPWSGHLRLYTEATFARLAELDEASLTPGEPKSALERNFFSLAERIEPDAAGRIAIPKMHLDLSGLGPPDSTPRDAIEVAVIGARTRLEVHDRAAWNAQAAERFRALPGLIAELEAKRAPG